MSAAKRRSHGELFKQLCWFIRLRWLAASAVVGSALIDLTWLHWFRNARWIAMVGAIILAYNLVLRILLERVDRSKQRRRFELIIAWAQLLLDLASLTLLSTWTGGLISPMATFFVFH